MAKACAKCGQTIPRSAWVNGAKKTNLQHRRYCLTCSPFGSRNVRRLEELRRNALLGLLCRRCGRTISDNQKKGRICWTCYFSARSARRLDEIYAIVGEACWRCGYSRGKQGRRVLEFHHVDRTTKLFGLDGRHLVNLSWQRVTAELVKCVLLCANCHREREAGLILASEIAELHSRGWATRSLQRERK